MLAQDVTHASPGENRPAPGEDGWVRLTPRNPQLGYRYIEIMCQMNRPTYETNRPQAIVRRMAGFPCEYYYYPGAGFEVVCGFKWNRRSRRYRMMSVGFVGAITPAAALDLVVEKTRLFLQDKQVDHLIAICPTVMESQAILEFYRLCVQHPRIVVRGTHAIENGTYLWVHFPASA